MTARVACAILVLAGGSAVAARGPQIAATRSTADGVFTSAQAGRGQKLYEERCASCHGTNLAGIEAASPLTGPAFTGSWEGASTDDLFDRIRVSMPYDKPGTLLRGETADLVAYILAFNGAPAGPRELSSVTGDLRAVRMTFVR